MSELNFWHQLHVRLSLCFALLVIMATSGYLWLDMRNNQRFHQELTQQLHRNLASYIVSHLPQPLFDQGGHANQKMMTRIAEQVMAINPQVEVYLLDRDGQILGHALPQPAIVQSRVNMSPVHTFLTDQAAFPLLGDDPRSRTGQGIFSASAISANGRVQGYLYVVLAGHDYRGLVEALSRSGILQRGLSGGLALALVLLGCGVTAFVMLTRPLRRLSRKIQAFRGDGPSLHHKMEHEKRDEIARLECVFDAMQVRIDEQFAHIQQNDRLRRELISNISHDLHTPLASIQGYIETLLTSQGRLTAAQHEQYLQVALRQSRLLSKRIGELFELSKLDDGRVQLQLESFPLAELLSDVVQSYSVEAEKKAISLEMELSQGAAIEVCADIGLIQRVLQNLIDNALRHTPQGGRVWVRMETGDADRVWIQVIDTGSGIAQPDLPLIFERYFRAGKISGDSQSGNGLGLAIVKRILDLHGALISVHSSLGAGTRIGFELKTNCRNIAAA
jgi:signal transduction histidine kinase